MKVKVKHLFATFVLTLALISTYSFCTNSAHAKSHSKPSRPEQHRDRDYHRDRDNHDHKFRPRNAHEIAPLSGLYYKYRVGELWGIYDETRGILAYPQYDDIVSTTTDFYVSKNGYWGVLSQLGQIKVPIEWESVKDIGIYYAVSRGGLIGWVNDSGQIIQQPAYTYVEDINSFLFSVCTDSGCGLAKYNGDIIVQPTLNGIIDGIDEVKYSVCNDGLCGMINILGEKITDFKYPEFTKADHNVVYTKSYGNLGLTSAVEDREIIKPQFEKIEPLSQKGYYKVKKNGKWGAVGYDGTIAYPCQYGPLEINRLMNDYPQANKFISDDSYNYYYYKFMEGIYYILVYDYKNAKAKKALREVLSSENRHQKLKDAAQKIVEMYGIVIN